VADRNNDRVVVITPHGQLLAWKKSISGPAAAFPSPTGRSISVTEPAEFIVEQIAVKDGVAFYHYGHSGKPGSADNRLHDPTSADELSDGKLVIADKSNCRVLIVTPPHFRPSCDPRYAGHLRPQAPSNLAYPDAALPAASGDHIVVTESNPGWVDVMSAAGTLINAVRVPGLSAPDDANEFASGELIATSHTRPG